MNVSRLIEASYNQALKALTMGTSRQSLYRARERAYVKSLIAHLQGEFGSDELRIFAASERGNAADFGANRLLYDIVVARVGKGKTTERQAVEFLYLAEALWQIEIDFSGEWRQALYAINRLNGGAAAGKLLIASVLSRGNERFSNSLRAAGAAGSGALYLALVPHPADWDDAASAPQVFEMTAGDWVELT